MQDFPGVYDGLVLIGLNMWAFVLGYSAHVDLRLGFSVVGFIEFGRQRSIYIYSLELFRVQEFGIHVSWCSGFRAVTVLLL